MTSPTTLSPTHTRDVWVGLGLTVSATSAALSSFDGLRSLAEAAGWSVWMAPLLPLTIDSFAATATKIWLSAATTSRRAQVFARNCAVGAILLSLVGNAAWHLIAADLLPVTWPVVLAVGAVSPVALGLVSHLAILRRQSDPSVPQFVPETTGTVPRSVLSSTAPSPDGPRYATEDALLTAARAADATHRTAHDGKGITRDQLRRELRIGGERATAVLRRLRAEQGQALL